MLEKMKEVKALLATPRDIVLTSHRNPDGDAIGSSLGLYHYLVQLGHTVKVAFPSEFPPNFAWMPNSDDILIFDLEPKEVQQYIERADIIFALDFNALDRIDKMGEVIDAQHRTTKIMIDHHRDPEPFVDYMLSDITASSTSELVYRFVQLLDDMPRMNIKIAECLYTGIVTDTASFRHATTPRLFRIVAELLEIGVDDYKVQDLIYNQAAEKNLRLLGHCLANRMEILGEYRTGIITLSKQDYEKFDIQRGDTEGIVNYLLSLKNVQLACFITEQPTIVKISLRSKGDFNVQELCRDHFKGGGHKNASGGYSFNGLKTTLQKFKDLLPQYQMALIENGG